MAHQIGVSAVISKNTVCDSRPNLLQIELFPVYALIALTRSVHMESEITNQYYEPLKQAPP